MIHFSFKCFPVERIKIKIGHQLFLDMIDGFSERFNELVKVFFVKENLVPFIRVIHPFLAFRDGKEVIVGLGRLHVEKIRSALSRFNLF